MCLQFSIDGSGLIFCEGQVLQLVSTAKAYGKAWQVYMSVSETDTAAIMLCHPWAHVDPFDGGLTTEGEPAEYYRVRSAASGSTQILTGCNDTSPFPVTGEGQVDDDGEEVAVEVSCSSLLDGCIQVDWARLELGDPESAQRCIESTILNDHILQRHTTSQPLMSSCT